MPPSVAEHAGSISDDLLGLVSATRSQLKTLQGRGLKGVPKSASPPSRRLSFEPETMLPSAAEHAPPSAHVVAQLSAAPVASLPAVPMMQVLNLRRAAVVEAQHEGLFEPGAMRGADGLATLQAYIGACMRCKLCHGRNSVVFADGAADAMVAFVGEGPGADEDRLGRPFVGAAGQLLDRMIDAMGNEARKRGEPALGERLSRSAVYICNVVKCRPPGNRAPEPDETSTCSPFLRRQLLALPSLRVIVALGRTPAQYLFQTSTAISQLRGKLGSWEGIPLVATYHPAYLLRTPSAKALVWEDLKLVIGHLANRQPSTPAELGSE